MVRLLKKAIDDKKVAEQQQLVPLLQADLDEKDACLRAMKAEKERMEDRLSCILCMDAEVTTAFTPCSHLCCCEACSRNPALVNCPICREPIASKDRIYLK